MRDGALQDNVVQDDTVPATLCRMTLCKTALCKTALCEFQVSVVGVGLMVEGYAWHVGWRCAHSGDNYPGR